MKVIVATTIALVLGSALNSAAQDSDVRIAFDSGRVYLVAEGLASDVLAEWARVGKTEISGAALVADRKVSVGVKGITESEALQLILGEEYGYLGSPKTEAAAGTSQYAVLAIATLESLLRSEKLAGSQPESSYVYLTPEKATLLDYSPTISPLYLEQRPSELTYVYYAPEKSGTIDAKTVEYVEIDPSLPPPEVRFEYYSGEEYVIQTTTRYLYDSLYRYPLADPEVRYTYFTPPKAMP